MGDMGDVGDGLDVLIVLGQQTFAALKSAAMLSKELDNLSGLRLRR
jgi:hypothetical protein